MPPPSREHPCPGKCGPKEGGIGSSVPMPHIREELRIGKGQHPSNMIDDLNDDGRATDVAKVVIEFEPEPLTTGAKREVHIHHISRLLDILLHLKGTAYRIRLWWSRPLKHEPEANARVHFWGAETAVRASRHRLRLEVDGLLTQLLNISVEQLVQKAQELLKAVVSFATVAITLEQQLPQLITGENLALRVQYGHDTGPSGLQRGRFVLVVQFRCRFCLLFQW